MKPTDVVTPAWREGRRRSVDAIDTGTPDDPAALEAAAPSKTQRKAAMHDLQDLGESLVRLGAARRAQLQLPERLDNAIVEAQSITKWEGRRRQMQYIGKLMRDVDPEPIRARMEEWNSAPAAEKARLASIERWRERLMTDEDSLEALCVSADVPTDDRQRLAALVARTKSERLHNQPPHAYRELFRLLNRLLTPKLPVTAPADKSDE